MALTGEDRASLLFEIDRFYARQQAQLDTGDIDGFGRSFVADASFGLGSGVQVPGGRAGIVGAMSGLVDRFRAARVQRHHWFGMRRVDTLDDGAIESVYYAIVSHTTADGTVTFEPSSVVTDHLVRTDDGELAVRSRLILLDAKPAQ